MSFGDVVWMALILGGAVYVFYRSFWKKRGHCPGCPIEDCEVGRCDTVKKVAIGLAVLAWLQTAEAYRPFATEDAGVAGSGVIQLEMSWDVLHWGADAQEDVWLLVPVIGVTNALELSFEIPRLRRAGEEGFGDFSMVGKFLLAEETGDLPSLAVKGVLKTVTGDERRGLGSSDEDWSLVAAASKTWGPLTWHAQIGYTFVGANGKDQLRNVALYGLGWDARLSGPFHLVGEVVGNQNTEKAAAHDPLSGLLGAIYAFSDRVVLDLGVRVGLTEAFPHWNTTFGLSMTF